MTLIISLIQFFKLLEYCGQIEPLVRNLEPVSAWNRAKRKALITKDTSGWFIAFLMGIL